MPGIRSAFADFLLAVRRQLIECLSQRAPRWSPARLVRSCTALLFASAMALPLAAQGTSENTVWLKVDTRDATLTVMKGDKAEKVFKDISIGRYGTTDAKMEGDHRTPLGRFTIAWIPQKSRYHRFLGLSYPDIDRAERALADGKISEAQWQAISRASASKRRPPQNTPLGGFIGIHGTGAGDLKIHQQYNWTNGCIALTNEQIDRLMNWVQVGTPVEIR
ncbi:MAG: L,D-transpeptidase catalytic domain protein [Candidatus Accumulibacter appositus]|uniref:L,D-transpeptidase catalytic domain protein n=2 Tax=Candidatus Accumulibacter TaxID=327159 RepID=A0A011PX42_9PROT|nr:MAG: L,D-transpeptidase catalytic domain protein [Candidatus Accumulibacter appositus]